MISETPSYVYVRFADFFEARTGQRMSSARSWRIDAALRPIARQLGLRTLEELANRLDMGDKRLATAVSEALLNNESSFFRDMATFGLLREKILPKLAQNRSKMKRLRIWSAGCSTGQEVYSLAIMLRDEAEKWDGWRVEILGTDVSAAAIAQARRGVYSQFEIQRGLPVRTMLCHFTQEQENWTIDPVIRETVRFGTHNLLEPAPGRFDLILCRNVMMYLKPVVRHDVFARLAAALTPDGALLLGAGETVTGQTDRFVAHPEWRGFYAMTPSRATANA